jgi:glycine cleavage system pyridoxal-binding protein P
MMEQNKTTQCHIGQGYYPVTTPLQVKRYVLENPRWYTAYTPYQAEVSQGRLEMLHNYQVMIQRITGMELANSSLLDEANAAIESMFLAKRFYQKKKKGKHVFLLDTQCYEHIKKAIYTSAEQFPNDLDIVEIDWSTLNLGKEHHEIKQEIVDKVQAQTGQTEMKDCVIGSLFQSPNAQGIVNDFTDMVDSIKSFDCVNILGTDLMFR